MGARAWRLVRPLVPGLVFLAAILAMCWRIWTPIDGARRAFGWDALWEYWGDLQFQIDAYRDGALPLWNPFDRAGYPFHADPQAGVLYPVNWALVALGLALGAAPAWLIALKTVLHLWLAALGVYVFLRRRGVAVAACYAGGFVFVLTYPFMHNSFSALNWSMAWAPWALCAVDAWAARPTAGRAALVALTLGLAQLAGAMAAFWYTLLIVVPYGAWAVVHHARAAAERRPYAIATARGAGLALALFVALVVAQTQSTAALVPHTVRDVRDLDFITVTAFGVDDLLSFAIPRFPGENCYVGLATILWAIAAVSLRPSPRRLVLVGVAALGVLCAFGNVGPFLAFDASVAPPFGFFRRAHRYLYVAVLPLAILGAEGLDELLRAQGQRLRRRLALFGAIGGGAAALVLAIGFVVTTPETHKDASPYRDAYGFGVGAALAAGWITFLLARLRGRGRAALGGVAVAVLALDLAMAQTPKLELNLHPPAETPNDAAIARLAGVPDEVRIYDREVLRYRPGIRLGVRDLGGYEGDPLALRRYAAFLDAARKQPLLLGHANVGWLLEAGKTRTKPREVPRTGLAPLGEVKGAYRVPAVAPRVAWHDAATIVPDAAAALVALGRATPGEVAVVEGAAWSDAERARATADGGRPPVAGRVIAWSRDRLEIEIDAPDDGVVVVAEAYYPGWRATVDGAPAAIAPANALGRAVVVGPGRHTIAMRYHAGAFPYLAPLVPLALLAIAALVVRERRRERAAQA